MLGKQSLTDNNGKMIKTKIKKQDSKPSAGEIKMISGGLTACRMLKSLNKAHEKEINSLHSRLPPVKMPRNDELDIVFSKRDG